ncbi:MAG: hypothetical protein AAGK37_16825 [Pseudomonadota bacterium]
MSDYDLQNRSETRRRAMEYTDERSGSAVWVIIGLVAVVALLGVLVAGAGGSGDGTAPTDGAVAPAVDTPPAAVGTDQN